MPVGNPILEKKAEAFIRGARSTKGAEGSTGTNGASRPRLPQGLTDDLRDLAWWRRTNLNALIVRALEEYVAAAGEELKQARKTGKR